MRKIVLLLVVALVSVNSSLAQEWLTDFEQAKAIAKSQEKKLILVFQGSDWCAPCIKLDKEIWSTNIFKDYAKEHFVMLKADFPKRKKNALSETQQNHNNKLAELYNKNGYFPYVVIMDANGKLLGSTGYKKMEPSEYINILEAF